MVRSAGWSASAWRTSSSAISASIAVAEIGWSSVIDRVTARMSAKRTRTVTVRPGRDLALSRVATRSARCSSVGRNTLSSAGFLPIADCAPADCARRCVVIARGSRFQASAASFSPAAGPSSRSSDRPGVLANCPIVVTPVSASRALRDRPDAPHQADRQVVQKRQLGRRVDDHEPVGLCDLRGDLGQMLGARHADRDRQAEFVAHPPPDRSRDLFRRAEQMRAAGDVGKGLVDRNALDQRREIAEHANRGVAEPLVLLEMPADEDQLRAEFPGAPPRHAAVHAEGLRLIGRGEHDPAADGDRLAAQRRIEQLLDRRVERVEIGMQDGRRGFHADRSVQGCKGASDGSYRRNIKGTSGHACQVLTACGQSCD